VSAAPSLVPGKEIGELTLVHSVEERRRGNIVWKCECRCGRPALRTASYLRYCLRTIDRTPMCLGCFQELQAGRFIAYRDERKTSLAKWFEDVGDLYAPDYVEMESAELMDELEQAIAPRVLSPLKHDPSRQYVSTKPGGGPDWSRYYPMQIARPAPCDLCEGHTDIGFGCVGCLKWMCADCVRAGDHCMCRPNWDHTLECIGTELGVSRERVRQIEVRGLRKLQHPARSRPLAPFVDLDLTYFQATQRRTETRLRYFLYQGLPWIQDAIYTGWGSDASWLTVEAFLDVAESGAVDEETLDRVRFVLRVAPDAKAALKSMADFTERHRETAEEARQKEEARKQQAERAHEERRRQEHQRAQERLKEYEEDVAPQPEPQPRVETRVCSDDFYRSHDSKSPSDDDLFSEDFYEDLFGALRRVLK
jgi:hypothetical protein